jgi:F0F1-type ATP synthase membrane subunit b/b'
MDTHFWETVSFLIFIILVYRPVARQISLYLKDYSKNVKDKIDESTKLRIESEKYLEFYEEEASLLASRLKIMLRQTEENVSALLYKSKIKLDEQIEIRKRMHDEKVVIYQKEATSKLKLKAIDEAILVTRSYLTANCHKALSSDDITDALKLVHNQVIH